MKKTPHIYKCACGSIGIGFDGTDILQTRENNRMVDQKCACGQVFRKAEAMVAYRSSKPIEKWDISCLKCQEPFHKAGKSRRLICRSCGAFGIIENQSELWFRDSDFRVNAID